MRAQFGETEQTIIQTTRWCITVPAIWDDKAKDTMKKGQCCCSHHFLITLQS